jgi:DNA-binding LacI/PurR family transcriptional regulator/DNA-binding transcriptional regulator YhcF (GntR family)
MNSKWRLDRKSDKPLYRQLRDILMHEMTVGKLSKHDILPKEEELSATFNLSRDTVSKAIGLLAIEGVVERIKRKGTVIKRSVLPGFNTDSSFRQVGLLFPLGNSWMGALRSMQRSIEQAGFNLLIYPYDWLNLEAEKNALEKAKKECVGIILYPNGLGNDQSLVDSLVAENYPIVLFDLYFPASSASMVTQDNFLGSYTAVKSLLKHNRKRIGYAGRKPHLITMQERLRGYKYALSEAGISFDHELVFYADENCENNLKSFIVQNKLDGIFANCHDLGLICLEIGKELNLKIPEEFQIAKYDTLESDDFIEGKINSVIQPEIALGRTAAELVLSLIRTGNVYNDKIFKIPGFKERY